MIEKGKKIKITLATILAVVVSFVVGYSIIFFSSKGTYSAQYINSTTYITSRCPLGIYTHVDSDTEPEPNVDQVTNDRWCPLFNVQIASKSYSVGTSLINFDICNAYLTEMGYEYVVNNNEYNSIMGCSYKPVESFTIQFAALGGTPIDSITGNYNQTITLPGTSMYGYTFGGWNDSKGNTYAAGTTYTITGNEKLWAVWEVPNDEFVVAFDPNGGTLQGSSTKSCSPTEGMCIVEDVPFAVKEGYTFTGWGVDSSCTSGGDVAVLNSSYTILYACYVENSGSGTTTKTFKATFDANGGTLNGKTEDTCDTSGTSCTVTNLPTSSKTNHTFTGWGTSSSCTSGKTDSLTLTAENTKYYACYTENSGSSGTTTKTINIRFMDYDGSVLGFRSCETTNLTGGCIVEALTPSPSREGYTFIGWTKFGNDCSNLWTESLNTTDEIGVYACYTKNEGGTTPTTKTVTINFYNGTTKVDTKTCDISGNETSCTITLPANPSKSGYTFKGWGTSSSCTGGKTSAFSVTENGNYYACYTKNNASQNADNNQNVTDNPGTGEVAIFIVWIIGIAAIVYSIWYFRKNKLGKN